MILYRNEIELNDGNLADDNALSDLGPVLQDVSEDEDDMGDVTPDPAPGRDSQEPTTDTVYVKYPCDRCAVSLINFIVRRTRRCMLC